MAGVVLEYSKSSRARCHGEEPCKGTPIDKGVLRLGECSMGQYGETVAWRHWGCASRSLLRSLAGYGVENVAGYRNLTSADQAKVKKAAARGAIDPADVPVSAQSLDLSSIPSSLQGMKRKHSESSIYPPSSSQPGPSSSSQPRTSSYPSSQREVHTVESDYDNEEDAEGGSHGGSGNDELYCVMTTQVVGIQYYNGLVGSGEEVMVEREPHNQYDRNAIVIRNIAGDQVGHLSRNVSSRLSPLMDAGLVNVEGLVKDGNLSGRTGYTMKVWLKIYGNAGAREVLEPRLAWATPSQRGFPPPRADGSHDVPGASSIPRSHRYAATGSQEGDQMLAGSKKNMTAAQMAALENAEELRNILANMDKVDDGNRRDSLMDKLCPTEDVLSLPDQDDPPGIDSGDLLVDLLKHQRQALRWCLDHEFPEPPKSEDDKPVQFWQIRKNGSKSFYYNVATRTPMEAVPELGRGGLCADSMGLGKTLTMLALILATKREGSPSPHYSRSTLIVVPLSVLSNWEKQIEEHCAPDALKSHIYYGPTGRNISPEKLRKYDVVITTYQVVTAEHGVIPAKGPGEGPSKKPKTHGKGLFAVPWKRIILDEGHSIRNAKTKMAKAVCGLEAERRWVVTGTPIINSPRDLGSILQFLRVCKPLDKDDFFNRLILRPLQQGQAEGGQLLRAIMTQICIRRTKEMQDSEGNALVPLPGIEMVTIPVSLDVKTRELYDRVEELSKQRVETFMNEHGGTGIPTTVLSMLTRLRQIVLHPGLIPANYVSQLESAVEEERDNKAGKLVKVTPELKAQLQWQLAQMIEDSEECPICFTEPNEPRITGCGHMFCLPCIREIIARDPKCPLDRRQITMLDLVEPAPPTELTQRPPKKEEAAEDIDVSLQHGSSAKIKQLIKLLELTPGNEKSLVFSQFTSFLDKIAQSFDEAGIAYVRFDGKMSARSRKEVIKRFTVPVQSADSDDDSSRVSSPIAKRQKRSKPKRKNSVIDIDSESDTEDDQERSEAEDTVSSKTEVDSDDEFVSAAGLIAQTKAGKPKATGKGKSKVKVKTTHFFNGAWGDRSNPKVMLISLKAGALGLNLTVANNVYLMDPWWQEGIESQAIDRCNRIGQKKKVHVYQLIAENTVESKVLDIQERKKKLVSQAFSGIKNADNPHQKREARLQDIIQIFGMRREKAELEQATQHTSEGHRRRKRI